MNVLLHADGGPGVGLGHASRCSALAAALVRAGHRAVVAVDPTLGLDDYLEKRGAQAIACPANAQALRDEAQRRGTDLIVIDSYRWLAPDFLALAGDWSIVAFDDEATRELPVDGIINGAPTAESLAYKAVPDTRLWLGTPYQVIRDEFRMVPVREPAGEVRRMIVLVGGDDPLRLLPLLAPYLDAVATAITPSFLMELICGPFTPPPDIAGLAHVNLLRNPTDLRQRMLAADLAISASGQTLYELARCGVPTVAFCSGADQRHNLAALARQGVVWDTGDATEPGWLTAVSEAIRALSSDPARRNEMIGKAQQLIDGRGAERLAVELEQWVAKKYSSR
jgi:UDP-2,4-diacetamido-2,4,6-trideoxy-beta-L-altropyranose hydrolase